ncbi:MAG: hypothetical protein ACRDTD_17755, partial [Pseudonocardiaceae bacterium]
ANGHTDSTIEAIRRALDAIEVGHPGGMVLPLTVLRGRVERAHAQLRACRFAELATDLPGLMRDLHTTLGTGNADHHREVLALGVRLHVHVVRMWLNQAFASLDLRRQVVSLAHRLAHSHGDPAQVGVAIFGVADVLSVNGGLESARAVLDDLTLPSATRDTAGLLIAVLFVRGMMAVVDGHSDDATAPLESAADLAAHFGEYPDDPLGFAIGPTSVAFHQVRIALEAGNPERAVSIAREVNPVDNPFPASRVYHWVGYGRAMAQLREHHGEAVQVLRTAEKIHPHRVLRDPFVRDTLASLLRRSRRGSPADQELRGMARRAGLPV